MSASSVLSSRMDKFKPIREVGEGSFGNVWQAINTQTGEIVAIKKLKGRFSSWEQCLNLPEVRLLPKMNHPNIIKLKELIQRDDVVYFVFDYMEANLSQIIEERGTHFSEAQIRRWCFQVFNALAYMQENGVLHRDLKPENLLVTGDLVKIADFGLARKMSPQAPYTSYVATRWYRAPELLLKSTAYDSAVDTWAMGAIIAELFLRSPLFPGSSEADQLYKICRVIGSPNRNSWADGLRLAATMNYQFPQFTGVDLSLLMPSASVEAIDLISSLCSWDPRKRPSAAQALQHPFFHSCYHVPPSLRPRVPAPAIPPGFGPLANPKRCIPSTKTKCQPRMGLKDPALAHTNENARAAAAADLAKQLTLVAMKSGQQMGVAPQPKKSARWNGNGLACSIAG